ncbi:MBL fold metallo-hydrolase [Amycolatopsis sp. WGS_07]|uniref:MBL fold metallo-hydrolase n=1 Tax=Amycolatopsis sp. WGS_07 TaxID=3076764 RepID=UPI003873763F
MSDDLDAAIGSERHRFAIGTLGGPTAVLDYGGLRFVTDPTFDPPGDYGAYRKTEGPAVSPGTLGAVDAVLLSHDLHWDNFDRAGRVFAQQCPLIVTGRRGAGRLGPPAIGLDDFDVHRMGQVRVHAVPAQHGPLDGDRDDAGDINTEVHGFVLEAHGLPTVYVSGDNAGIGPVKAIARAFPHIDVAVLHCGAARVASKNGGRPLTLTSARAADVAALLEVSHVVAVHHEGWSIYSENFGDLDREFAEAGLRSRLIDTEPGQWALRQPDPL